VIMNKRLLGLLLPVIGLVATLPCGAQEAQRVVSGSFDRLEVSGAALIELSQGPRDEAQVVGDDGGARLSVVGHTLRVHTGDSWKFWSREQTHVKVQMRNVSRIIISGASDIRAAGPLQVEQLGIDISGQGQVRLDDVRAEVLRFEVSGAGDGEVAGQGVAVAGARIRAQAQAPARDDDCAAVVTDLADLEDGRLTTPAHGSSPRPRRAGVCASPSARHTACLSGCILCVDRA